MRLGADCEHGTWRCPGCGVIFPKSTPHMHDDAHAFCSEGCAIRHFQDDARIAAMSEAEASRFLDWLFVGL